MTRKIPYSITRICGDDPDPRDPSQEEWYVEISIRIEPDDEPSYKYIFGLMWKRNGRFVVNIGGMEAGLEHDLEDLADAFQRAKQTLDVLYPDS